MFEDALAGRRGRPRRAASGSWSASTGSARPRRSPSTAPTSSSTTSPSCSTDDPISSAYAVDPWAVRETGLDLDLLAQTESVFALSNGHIGLRGNLDEGEPHGLPGTYLNGFYEIRPLPYAEAGYGYPESGQTVVNVTNGKLIRLLVGDEPFDVRYGTLRRHERILDLRAGHADPGGRVGARRPGRRIADPQRAAGVASTQRAIAAISYEVEPVDGAAAGRGPVRAGRQRAAAGRRATIPAPPPCWRRRWSLRVPASAHDLRARAGPHHRGQRAAARGRRWTT